MLKDYFPREGRWESVGLDCSYCQFFKGPQQWPDKHREIFCNLHKVSLQIELGQNGYKEGEWFCRNFRDNNKTEPNALQYFEKSRESFDENILYRFLKKGDALKEIEIPKLRRESGEL